VLELSELLVCKALIDIVNKPVGGSALKSFEPLSPPLATEGVCPLLKATGALLVETDHLLVSAFTLRVQIISIANPSSSVNFFSELQPPLHATHCLPHQSSIAA